VREGYDYGCAEACDREGCDCEFSGSACEESFRPAEQGGEVEPSGLRVFRVTLEFLCERSAGPEE
jgi:hypothetical protein